jgi:hypothetical protein
MLPTLANNFVYLFDHVLALRVGFLNQSQYVFDVIQILQINGIATSNNLRDSRVGTGLKLQIQAVSLEIWKAIGESFQCWILGVTMLLGLAEHAIQDEMKSVTGGG